MAPSLCGVLPPLGDALRYKLGVYRYFLFFIFTIVFTESPEPPENAGRGISRRTWPRGIPFYFRYFLSLHPLRRSPNGSSSTDNLLAPVAIAMILTAPRARMIRPAVGTSERRERLPILRSASSTWRALNGVSLTIRNVWTLEPIAATYRCTTRPYTTAVVGGGCARCAYAATCLRSV